jgi:hypothetical protein
LLARRHAARGHWLPPAARARLRQDRERLREACDVSAADLEAAVSGLKHKALERVRALERTAREARLLRAELVEKRERIAELQRVNAALELSTEEQLLRLQRQEDELRARASALATAEQTIALLRDALHVPGRAPPNRVKS